MKDVVSVIVPIYNTDKYLGKCITSLLNQSYPYVEIILIDDGSTDQSKLICESYQKKYEHIKYIYQENQGVAIARNTGIKNATGKYIVFVDSDDYVNFEYLKCLSDMAQEVDLVICGYYQVNSSEDILFSSMQGERSISNYSANEYLEKLFLNQGTPYQGYLFNKIFITEIINNNHLFFDEKIAYNEDRLFLCTYLKYCNKVCENNIPYYYYLLRDNSAMGLRNKSYNVKMNTELLAFKKMMDLVKNNTIVYVALLQNAFSASLSLEMDAFGDGLKEVKKYRRFFGLYLLKSKDITVSVKVLNFLRYARNILNMKKRNERK